MGSGSGPGPWDAVACPDGDAGRPEGPTTVERLVAAAGEVFAERGYDRVRVQDIARRAGMTTGAIYANFRNKAVLLLQTISAVTGPNLEVLDHVGASGDGDGPADQLGSAAGGAIAQGNSRARALLLEAFVAARRDGEVHQLLCQRVVANTQRLTEQVEKAKADGDIDPELDTRAVVRFMQSMRFGVASLETVDAPMPTDDAWRSLMATVMGALRPGAMIDGARPAGRTGPTDDAEVPSSPITPQLHQSP